MAAVNPSYVSIDMDLSFNSASYGSPTWAVVAAVDVKVGITMGEADLSNRGSKQELKEPTLQGKELNFGMVPDETDATFVAIRAALLARTAVEFAVANGPIGTAGTVASGGTVNVVMSRQVYKVFSIERDEPLNGAPMVSITCKPCKLAQTNTPTDNALIA